MILAFSLTYDDLLKNGPYSYVVLEKINVVIMCY